MPKLTAKKIYEKEFATSLKGYNQDEVDAFLDIILEDYEEFTKKIYKLESEISFLNDQAQKKNFRSNSIIDDKEVNSQSNLDLLQRVSNLEKAVFGKSDT